MSTQGVDECMINGHYYYYCYSNNPLLIYGKMTCQDFFLFEIVDFPIECLLVCPQGNQPSKIPSLNLQGWSSNTIANTGNSFAFVYFPPCSCLSHCLGGGTTLLYQIFQRLQIKLSSGKIIGKRFQSPEYLVQKCGTFSNLVAQLSVLNS